ncbi:MAG: hypothetical protein HQL91_07615 [Magnetococcales bacterium]|nr:hypothetical protein [Magnetococcales bacterium]
MFEWIVSLLNHPATPWTLALSIPVLAVLLWWRVRQALLQPLFAQIQAARDWLDETPDLPEAFFPAFRLLDGRLSGLPLLARPWRNFTASLLQSDAPKPMLFQTRQPEAFFRLELLTAHHPQAVLLQAMPTLLIAIGVLFTFVGVAGALHFAARGLLTAEPETTRQALRGVLSMAALKFLSSITAILAAGVVSWRMRRWQRVIGLALTVMCDQLGSRCALLTPGSSLQESSAALATPEPMIQALKEEGKRLSQRLESLERTLHLLIEAQRAQPARERQVVAASGSDAGGHALSRSEQESWMRIIDRMELAAHALEKQSEGLSGLSALADETRRASEGSIRAGHEAVEKLMDSIANFNSRMEGSFAHSAEVLLTRLAHNNQKVVSQVIAQLDRDQLHEITVPDLGKKELPQLFDQFLRTRGGRKETNH